MINTLNYDKYFYINIINIINIILVSNSDGCTVVQAETPDHPMGTT